MLERLLYVSQSQLAPDRAGDELRELVDQAIRRNRGLGVTGGLIFTGHRFAQWLEGPADAVDRLFRAIQGDARHTGVQVILRGPADERLFPDWNLAFSGSSLFVDRRIKACLGSDGARDAGARRDLEKLMREFAERALVH